MTAINLSTLRADIVATKHIDEHRFVTQLLTTPPLTKDARTAVEQRAATIVADCRKDIKSQTLLDSFLQEYGLSNQEGVALMCLAEALLRVPDNLTADRLIAEKFGSGQWLEHIGESKSWLVNASTWGLVLTGKAVELDSSIQQKPNHWLRGLITKLGRPIIRTAVLQAMKFMGGQYVLGRTIDEGIKKGERQRGGAHEAGARLSFDMLGEGARTQADADRYFDSYLEAFEEVGALNDSNSVISAHGVSVKLSALHAQYHHAHYHTVMSELLPKITQLAKIAKRHNIGLSIDAEEAARLEMSLDIFQALCENPELANWRGLGFVMQAYQKRAPAVAQWLVELAKKHKRTIMVRLVKGAYWDTEIKHAQEQGLSDYPVFTRKVNTDVCYLHCARILLSGGANVFAQFATHNAHTAVAVQQLASEMGVTDYEFQRLHGMGELLYKHMLNSQADNASPSPALRIYAPVGQHRDLLPYLVRRLLENGANSSFVNRLLDPDHSPANLVRDCYDDASDYSNLRHSRIPIPDDIFISAKSARKNAQGLDLDDAKTTDRISHAIGNVLEQDLLGHPIVNGHAITTSKALTSPDPSNGTKPAGQFHKIDQPNLELALGSAFQANNEWQTKGAKGRATVLNTMADLLEQHTSELVGLVNREAGRTIADCVSEVREAVDFCRYYAEQAILNQRLPAQGVFLCISPWNFPLAIFTGQISAALAVGNSVLAKPADPTPIIATRVTQLFHQAGVPTDVLHLVIGDGPSIGAKILPDPRLAGVAFTGSTEVAKAIHQTLGQRDGPSIPFIAETGGQNCMVVDSTALPEQVVDDVISSAFHSAGQRCSALRVLYVQDVIADTIMEMLEGALSLVNVGSPQKLSTDVGPIIDQRALNNLTTHIDYIGPLSKNTISAPLSNDCDSGTYFAPHVFEINTIKQLKREVFGPVLHVIRYKMSELDQVIQDINSTGYGLTFGVHSRIEAFADFLFDNTCAGNTYINRNTIGAAVGVNPFGGRGLSGTGPKAGGPSYVLRYQKTTPEGTPLVAADRQQRVREDQSKLMPGPTGEENTLVVQPVGNILFVLNEQTPLKELVAACNLALELGNVVTVTVRNIANQAQLDALLVDTPEQYHQSILINEENVLARVSNQQHQAIAIHPSHPELDKFRQRVAQRLGPITQLIEFDETILLTENLNWYTSCMSIERTKTDNLVAKGGNTQLFNLRE